MDHPRLGNRYSPKTFQYPDVTGLMQVLLEIHPETQSLILDSEIVAIDRATGSLKSFQALSSRARKDVRLEKVEISVGVFVFDLLYLDGEVSFFKNTHRKFSQIVVLRFY